MSKIENNKPIEIPITNIVTFFGALGLVGLTAYSNISSSSSVKQASTEFAFTCSNITV